MFKKHQTYLSQREYRFYVHSDIGPGESFYLLDVSPALVAATVAKESDPSPHVYYAAKLLDGEVGEEVEPNPLRAFPSLLGTDSPKPACGSVCGRPVCSVMRLPVITAKQQSIT